MSSYLSLTQLETLPVQQVTDVVTEFVQNVPLLPAHMQARSRTCHASIGAVSGSRVLYPNFLLDS